MKCLTEQNSQLSLTPMPLWSAVKIAKDQAPNDISESYFHDGTPIEQRPAEFDKLFILI